MLQTSCAKHDFLIVCGLMWRQVQAATAGRDRTGGMPTGKRLCRTAASMAFTGDRTSVLADQKIQIRSLMCLQHMFRVQAGISARIPTLLRLPT